MSQSELPRWTVAAIARTYAVPRWRVWHLIEKGAIPTERIDGRIFLQHHHVTQVMGDPPQSTRVVVYNL